MLSKILTSVLFFTLIGCETKEYKQSENKKVNYVDSLNRGDNTSVIEELSKNKESLTPREKYYLASAYSGVGGVDVYSLYPVLEIQLFRKNALEWNDLSKEQNPYLKFMKAQKGVDPERRLKKREERWEKDYQKLAEQRGWEEIAEPEEVGDSEINWKKEYKRIMATKGDISERVNLWYELESEYYHSAKTHSEATERTLRYYRVLIERETIKERYLSPEETSYTRAFGVSWEMVLMNVLWNTYEAIPVLKKLPTLSKANQENISKSLEKYQDILTTPEFKEVALKNILTLSGVSLLSIYKESFDFEDVIGMQDLICSFEPKVLMDNYEIIRNRLILISKVVPSIEGVDGIQEYKDKVESLKEILPESLSEEEKRTYSESYESFRMNSCYN